MLIAGDAIDRREHPLLDLRIEHTFLFHIPLLPGGLITTVTLAELSVGPLVARDQQERSARQAHLQQAEADFEPLAFDAAAARAFGRVAASLRDARRQSAPGVAHTTR